MIPREQVEALVGHAPGGVCPFAVWVDVCKGWLADEGAARSA